MTIQFNAVSRKWLVIVNHTILGAYDSYVVALARMAQL